MSDERYLDKLDKIFYINEKIASRKTRGIKPIRVSEVCKALTRINLSSGFMEQRRSPGHTANDGQPSVKKTRTYDRKSIVIR
jgi:hypothetical protein